MKQAKFALATLLLLAAASFAIASKAKGIKIFYMTSIDDVNNFCRVKTLQQLEITTATEPDKFFITTMATQPLNTTCPTIRVTDYA
ncbi:hypothetical protein [Chitinophaga sp. Cy-1792]|uniref:hypothetical protein n=1 Tax=Chitinophaga sp. Cy-1792 TaxID=2608339 RepID=UPI0014225D3A|nr:hypothetical protein [Chitinophaga sp. Cy-1792]NIG57504.1 hypothetical protein [Chitinophaga sp. Cy-1792]